MESGEVSAPPDEELLYYYLMKKVSYEPIHFDVIREVDLNELEPWDLKGVIHIKESQIEEQTLEFISANSIVVQTSKKCRIGSGLQNEFYFFSHKDKKYPTGTRTNRATRAGFWKATGRDKAIHMSTSKRIGMRKTLVFYTGRAPHGQKTDWIMHEYRLDDVIISQEFQEDGWVICSVFKKKNHTRGFHHDEEPVVPFHASGCCTLEPNDYVHSNNFSLDSMHLPQLLNPEPAVPSSYLHSLPLNLLSLASVDAGPSTGFIQLDKLSGDWPLLDKFLATPQTMDHISKFHQVTDLVPTGQRFQFQNGFEQDFSGFHK